MTRQYASKVMGEKQIGRSWKVSGALRWHLADKGGRMYRCSCMPSFRAGDRVIHPKAGAKYRGWMNHKP